jgi:hypothetical protein
MSEGGKDIGNARALLKYYIDTYVSLIALLLD